MGLLYLYLTRITATFNEDLRTFMKIPCCGIRNISDKSCRENQNTDFMHGNLENRYGCETWSLILREERRLRVFENKMLRRIFGTRRARGSGGLEEIP